MERNETPNEERATMTIRADIDSQSIVFKVHGELSLYIHRDDIARFTSDLMRALEALDAAQEGR